MHNSRNFESRFRIDVLDLPAYPIFMTLLKRPPYSMNKLAGRRSWNGTGGATASSSTLSGPPEYSAVLLVPAESLAESKFHFFRTPAPRNNRGTPHASDAALRRNRTKTLIPSWWDWHVSS